MKYPAALLAVVVIGNGGYGTMQDRDYQREVQTQTQQCQEDEPCFDCRTMGNRQCGPGWHDNHLLNRWEA